MLTHDTPTLLQSERFHSNTLNLYNNSKPMRNIISQLKNNTLVIEKEKKTRVLHGPHLVLLLCGRVYERSKRRGGAAAAAAADGDDDDNAA